MAIRFDYFREGRRMSWRTKDFTPVPAAMCAAALLLAVAPAFAQYPGQLAKPAQKTAALRAVSVLEWTGEEGHPKASRILPVSVFDGQQLQDAGIYLARPQPLALDGEVEYQLKRDGKTVGLYEIESAAQVQGAWVGRGTWKALPSAKPKPTNAELAKIKIDDDDSSSGPILHRKGHSGDASTTGAGSGSGSGSTAPPPDPDRPRLERTSPASDSPNAGGTTDDSGRPVLRKENKKKADDVAYVSPLPNITDPDRPRLIRGAPPSYGPKVAPTLVGLPADMHQMVAVSDARNLPDHLWNFTWANPADEAKMKLEMEDIARKALGLNPPAAPAVPAKGSTAKAGRKARAKAKAAPPPAPKPAPLVDEQFRVFELEYGSGATMVLTARTGGQGSQEKFVTLIAQPDLYGNLLVPFKSVTDMAHLDVTPCMKLIDAVDAMADNRGELLFELRGATQREFALYRVLRGQVEKLFVSSPYGTVIAP